MEMWNEVWALAEDQHGAFTTTQAEALGADGGWLARQRRDRRIDRIFRGAHGVIGLLDDWTVTAAAQLVQPRAVAGGSAAAKLHGFDGLDEWRPELLVPKNRVRGLVTRQVSDLVVPEIVVVDGLRCTDPVRTLVDWAAHVDDEHVERAMEFVLRHDPSARARLVDRATALSRPGKSGPARVLRVESRLPERRTESDLETVYWQLLARFGIPLPERQHPVGRFRLDLAWPDLKVFAELDGYGTHSSWEAFVNDRHRQNDVVIDGWVPLRFADSDVRRFPQRTAHKTSQLLERRRRDLESLARV
jgi:very-short-patch-repair endonuclease